MDEPVIDVRVARELVAAQFPQWAHLAVEPLVPGGWNNRSFRLGAGLVIRLPSAERYVAQVAKEQHWLPILAPLLPLPIPEPVGQGRPSPAYPFPWSICRWIEGETVLAAPPGEAVDLARRLGGFLVALQSIDAHGAPAPGPHNFGRGGPLDFYSDEVSSAIHRLGHAIDAGLAREAWQASTASNWSHAPVWLHGDVAPGNLLLRGGRLAAVIDFGTMAAGDPACDYAMAWTFFSGESRQAFREAAGCDEPTWRRGRGWALWKALIVAAGLPGTDACLAEPSRRVLDDILSDYWSSN